MASQSELKVRISADLADIKQGLGLLRGELAKVKSQANTALSGSTNGFTNGIKNAHRELRAFAATYLSLQGGKLLAGVADEATRLRGRIREAKGDYEAILAIANSTRTGLSATADLYTRVERSTRGRIKSQADLLALTKTVNQAIKLSYAGTAQGEAAVLQLGQALSSGKLAGDEFRSISENAPRLMQAIADGVGVPVGALKKLASEGKLTTEVIIAALLGQSKVMEDEYKRVPATIGDAFVQIRNSFVDFIGKADEANGASQKFAATLRQVAQDLPQYLNPLLDTIRLLVENLDVLAVYIGTRLALSAIPAMISSVAALRAAFIALRTATLSWSAAMATLGGPIGIALAALAAALYLVWKRTNDAKVAAEEHRKALSDNAEMAKVSADAAIKEAQAKRLQATETLRAARAALEERRARFAADNTSVTARGGDRGDAAALASANALNRQRKAVADAEKVYKDWGDRLAELSVEMAMPLDMPAVSAAAAVVSLGETADKAGKKAKAAIRGIIDENALLQDALKRTMDELDARFERGEIGIAAYYTAKRDLQLQAVDARIAEAQAEAKAATSTDQQTRALTEVVKLQRERAAIGPATALAQAKAEKELTDQLEILRGKLLDLEGGFGNEAAAKAQDDYEALLQKLGQSAEGADLAAKIFDIESAKARIDAIKAKAQEVITNLRSGTDYINSQQQLGALGPGEAERQLQALRGTSITQLAVYKKAMEDALAAATPGSPQHTAALQGLAEINTALADAEAAQHRFRNSIADQAAGALGGFFNDLIDGAKSFKEAFADMVRSFAAGVAKMIAQELALRAVRSIMGAWGGAKLNAKGNVFGAGGMHAFAKGAAFALPGLMAFANGGAFTNGIYTNPTLFQFGAGGQFGVMGEAGPEAVMPLSRGPDGKLGVAAKGGGAQRRQRIVIVDDARQAENFMRGSAMEEAVLYHLGKNPGRVKEIVG